MILELEHLTKRYCIADHSIVALDDVSLAVAAGEFHVIRGKSGCGKSTLLLTAGGLLQPDTGHVRLLGRDLFAMSGSDRAGFRAQSIGFVFQQFHLVAYLSVYENIIAPRLAIQSRANAADRTDADALIHRFGLDSRRDHRPDQLSIGERQRVAMARALMNRPSLLLADEPTGNLDPDNSERILRHLREFCDSGGAVIMVTHHPTDIVRIDQMYDMDQGQITPATEPVP